MVLFSAKKKWQNLTGFSTGSTSLTFPRQHWSRAWSGAGVFVVVTVGLLGLSREMTSELQTGIISNYMHALGQVTLLLPLEHLLCWQALPVVSRLPDDEFNNSLLEMLCFSLACFWPALLWSLCFQLHHWRTDPLRQWCDLGQQQRGFPLAVFLLPGFLSPFKHALCGSNE